MNDILALCYKRINEALKDKDAVKSLHKIYVNASFGVADLESNNVISEATEIVKSLKTDNKKISLSTHSRTIDNVLVYIFLKSIMTIPTDLKAYRLGLIDKERKLIKTPKTEEENDAISNLDLLMAKMRKWLKPQLSKLSSMSWVKSVDANTRIQNALSNAETLSKRYTVKKVNDTLDNILRQN